MSRSRWSRRSPTATAWSRRRRRPAASCRSGSQRVSSIVYQKAKDLLKSGAIGQVNMIEAWWDRNSAIGAWQYSIPPDASTNTVDWDRFLGLCAEGPVRADAPVPLAQLSRLRHRRRGRPVRPPVLRHALHHGRDRTDQGLLDRRTAVLERRPRCSRCHDRIMRLSRDRKSSRVQSRACG